MGSVNKVILVGNLGKDAEMKYTSGGTAVASFSLATTETWKDRNGDKKEQTEWHRVVVWDRIAEALHEYLKKGKQIYVEGKLQTKKWTDKNGQDRWSTDVRADRVVLLGGGRRDDGERPAGRRPRAVESETDEPVEDQIPQDNPADDDIQF